VALAASGYETALSADPCLETDPPPAAT
jgi:hypothetical protein